VRERESVREREKEKERKRERERERERIPNTHIIPDYEGGDISEAHNYYGLRYVKIALDRFTSITRGIGLNRII